MTERPILFMDAMVSAILEGRKTVTRRTGESWRFAKAGETLWVREAHSLCYIVHWPDLPHRRHPDHPDHPKDLAGDRGPLVAFYRTGFDRSPIPWRPSIHMPRWACRLTLEVVSVTLDRNVRGLDDAEAAREGFDSAEAFRKAWHDMHPDEDAAWRIEFRRLT